MSGVGSERRWRKAREDAYFIDIVKVAGRVCGRPWLARSGRILARKKYAERAGSVVLCGVAAFALAAGGESGTRSGSWVTGERGEERPGIPEAWSVLPGGRAGLQLWPEMRILSGLMGCWTGQRLDAALGLGTNRTPEVPGCRPAAAWQAGRVSGVGRNGTVVASQVDQRASDLLPC